MKKQVVEGYSAGSKWLHWIVAVLVLMMLSFGFFLGELPEQFQGTGYMLHKSIGLTILCLMCIRLFWIYYTGKPELPRSVPSWERSLSKFVQVSLYILLFAMPLAGWIMSVAAGRTPVFFGLFPIPLYGVPVDETLKEIMEEAHEIMAYLLIALIALHIAGALKHYFIDKDKILRRMLRDVRAKD